VKRRQFIEAVPAAAFSLLAKNGSGSGGAWPFSPPATRNDWSRIDAAGFSSPAYGIVFDGDRLRSGMPLGGLGTGYLSIEGDGKLGHSSIFNEFVPPKKIFADWLTVEAGLSRIPLSSARIAFWGHYPVADLIAEFSELPLRLGIRAFSPFIPGDAAASNIPAVLIEIEATNRSSSPLDVTLNLKFPAAPARASFAVRGEGIEPRDPEQSTYSCVLRLRPNDARKIRFAAAWSAPVWRDSGSEPHRNRYSQRFHDAAEAAETALGRYDELLRRILAWQSVLYSSDLPGWLQDALVQCFYSMAKNSVWIARTRRDEWWGENGWFTHSESHTGCPIVETMVCRMHGHFPLLYFFPELETTTLEAFRHFQIADGEIPFSFGQPTSMRDPRYHCQHPLNSGQYAQMICRLYGRTGDKTVLEHFYESAKRALHYQLTLDDDGCGLVHDQAHVSPGEAWPANQFYDIWPWRGVSCYVAGTWLATLAAGVALAKAAGDRAFEAECAGRLDKTQRAFAERLWNGSYYRLWNDAASGEASEVVLANQLMAQWCVRVAGLPDVLPREQVSAALDTVERLNFRATSYGLINGVTPEGKPFDTKLNQAGDHARHIFVGENLCAAMTFLYHGRRDAGIEIARRLFSAMYVTTRAPWNQRCLLNGETGLPQWGDDYYSNMVIWALPMALHGESVREFAQSGLAARVLRA